MKKALEVTHGDLATIRSGRATPALVENMIIAAYGNTQHLKVKEMATITGQKPVATYSRKDISNFKLRKGVAIGVRITLRGNNMYEFLDRLISAALPRIRDFKGINDKGFDGRGNYTLGVTEQIIFPEIDIDKVTKMAGMDITFVTSAKTDNEAHALLAEFGLPFKKSDKK